MPGVALLGGEFVALYGGRTGIMEALNSAGFVRCAGGTGLELLSQIGPIGQLCKRAHSLFGVQIRMRGPNTQQQEQRR